MRGLPETQPSLLEHHLWEVASVSALASSPSKSSKYTSHTLSVDLQIVIRERFSDRASQVSHLQGSVRLCIVRAAANDHGRICRYGLAVGLEQGQVTEVDDSLDAE